MIKLLCYILLFYNLFLIQPINAQSTKNDSLLIVLTSQKGEDKVKTYYNLVENSRNNTDSMVFFIRKGLDLSHNINYTKGIIDGYNELGIYWYYRGQPDSSIVATKNSLAFLSDKPSLERIQSFSNYGLALTLMTLFDESAEWHLKSLSDAEKLKDSTSIVRSLNNLGNIYKYLGDRKTSLKYYSEALSISEKLQMEANSASILSNIAQIQQNKGELKKAMAGFEKSAELSRKIDDQQGLAITLMDLGRVHEQLENVDKARDYYMKSLNLSRRIEDHIGVVYTSENLATLESKVKNYSKALQLLDTALAQSKKLNFKEGIKFVYDTYSRVYYDMKNYKAAYDNRILHEAWKDTIADKKYLQTVKELETKYETEKKQNEILRLSEENLKNEASIVKSNSRIRTILFTGSILGVLAIFGFIYFRQRSRLGKQNAVFEAMAQTEIKEQTRIARDLHDSIGAMLAATQNQLSGLVPENKNQEKQLKKAQELIAKTSDETRGIAHNMMPEELTKFGLINALESLLQSISISGEMKTEFVHFGMEKRLNPLKELHLYRIVQELFQNIQKHAKATKSSLQLTRHQNELNLIAEDNGIGFLTTKDKNDGLGMQNIQSRIDFLNGDLKIDALSGRGTSIVINIPLV